MKVSDANSTEDMLNRKELIDNIWAFIEYNARKKDNMSFAIDGKWGCGKTFIFNLIKERIVKEEKNSSFVVVYHNCWKCSYYKEPLIDILSSLVNSIIEANQNNPKEKVGKILILLSTYLFDIVNDVVNHITGIDISTSKARISKIKSIIGNVEEKNTKNNPNFLMDMKVKNVRKQLQELAKEMNIVILVDELDRCLPGYTIKILERLYNLLCGLDNITIIYAIDRGQLSNTIEKIYGKVVEVEDYLRKFIDFEVKIDVGELDETKQTEFEEYYKNFKGSREEQCFSCRFIAIMLKEIDIRMRKNYLSKARLIHEVYIKDTRKEYGFSMLCFEVFWIIMVQHYKIYNSLTMQEELMRSNPFRHMKNQLPVEVDCFLKSMFIEKKETLNDIERIEEEIYNNFLFLNIKNRVKNRLSEDTIYEFYKEIDVYDKMVCKIK